MIKDYDEDGRKPLNELYKRFSKLDLISEKIYMQHEQVDGEKIEMPILSFRSSKKGKSLWLMAGIHGEEPAGSNAVYENVEIINEYAKKFPVVLFPLLNPKGYRKDWRYPDLELIIQDDDGPVPSVGSSDHIVLNGCDRPRLEKPTCPEAEAFNRYILGILQDYPPILALDLHEDERNAYVYSHGRFGGNDPVALEVLNIADSCGAPIQYFGETLFGEMIKNGIVAGARDGSVADFLSSERVYVNGKIVPGPNTKSVVVLETSEDLPIEKRIEIHSRVIGALEKFYDLCK